eukprot:jgi/Phyca11/117321/e_gw1.33.176.1
MPPRRFVETEETFHFFNEDVVLGTNEIRSGDGSSSSDSDSSETSLLRRARRRRRASSVVSRRTSRRFSQLLNGSELGSLPEDEMLSDSDDDYDSLDDFELEEDREDEDQARERKDSTDNGDTEPQAAAGPRVPGVGVAKFEQVFDPFRDLYLPPTTRNEGARKAKGQQMQLRKARRALAAFARRVHCANGYRYRKQSEFMRVCYLRALESGPGYELLETAKPPLLTASQKEDAVETTVPNLFPRKWPHLPFRSPLQWHNDINAAIEFLSSLAELPETSLIYEPVDVNKFTTEITKLLEMSSCEETSGSSLNSDSTVAGLLGLFAMGVQLQSFTLLSKAALLFIEKGQAFLLSCDDENRAGNLRPELRELLDLYCLRLAKYITEPTLAATYPRDLSAQWKVCSYQPSTSDAIATDGMYLYIFGRSGLLKIGTGNGTTVRDFVYAHNTDYVRSRDAERSWLCCIGDSLYCRTIVMPSHRLDRIPTSDLKNVQEMVLAPNNALIGKGTTESSVYAMVTDGSDLYTIRCIDTYKKSPLAKAGSSRKHRNRAHKSRKSTPVAEIVTAVLGKSDGNLQSAPQAHEVTPIQVGDRVVRGPDWKWSNQDGDVGSPGTVERISTWGGVKGSGVTVRWDKNQRVNTYRWGAEACYDLYIVTEKDGKIIERKPLPNEDSSRQARGEQQTAETKRESEPEPLPRHQFVLYRHKVDQIISIMELDEADIDLSLDLVPPGDQQKQSSKGGTDTQKGVETLSALHSHTVALCTSKTSWMCDGGRSNCFGDNSAKRYRCTSGCDYDLCESCLFATVIDKPPGKPISESTIDDGDSSSHDNFPGIDSHDDTGTTEATLATSIDSTSLEGSDPFSTVDTSLFAESEREVLLKKRNGDKKKQGRQTEEQMVDDLFAFWCGMYSRKECQVALRRNGLQLNEASAWLHTCGAYLRDPMVVPTVSSVMLTAKPKSGTLDPVLLIAGTFYATLGQLCVVSPPGLYTVGDEHSDEAKRAANSCDASWFFSLETGNLLSDQPVLLKGIPAGSPTCVDMTHRRILVFSGYLNCLEEYVDHVAFKQHSLEDCMTVHDATLADTGKMIISQLTQLMRKRASLPAYKHIRSGLQDILFRLERESVSSDKQPGSKGTDGEATTKSRNRRIKNVRARLKELSRINVKDRPGHIIPFCVDFEDEGLFQTLRAMNYYCGLLSLEESSVGSLDVTVPTGVSKVVANLLWILTETIQEFEFVGVTLKISDSDKNTQQLFQDTERVLKTIASRLFDNHSSETHERSEIVLSAHFLLAWGVRKGVFCSNSRSNFFVSACNNVLARSSTKVAAPASLPDAYFSLLLQPHESLVLETKRDCDVDLLRRLLYSPLDEGRVAIADFVPIEDAPFSRFLEVLFALSQHESTSDTERKRWVTDANNLPLQTPVNKALLSVMNYCSARMYAANAEPPTTSLKEMGKEILEATATFESFARACFDCSLEILRHHQRSIQNPEAAIIYDLRSSVVGTILPMVIAFIPNFPEQFSDDFRAHLNVLMNMLDAVVCSNEKISSIEEQKEDGEAAIFGGYQVVETLHPYSNTQPVFRRVVHIPGASALHFEFDPRCRTSGEADIVFVTSGLAWYQADRLPYGDVGFGEDGGCFFGSYSRGNWPAGGLTIVGDTATVMLCTTTQSRSGATDKQRWGLKCTVRGLFDKPRKSWLLELGCGVANACSVIGDKLLRGLPLQNAEKLFQPWAMQGQLFNLPASSCNALKPSKWCLVDDIVDRNTRGETFFSSLAKYTRLRSLPPRFAARWTKALQEAAAVFLVRSDYRHLTAWLTSIEKGEAMSKDDECLLFQPIAIELGKLERWMLRQVQLVNEWHYLRMDEVSLEELTERYGDNLDRLSELCQLKGVCFKKDDMAGCVKKIHELLVEEIAAQLNKSTSQLSGSHEAVADVVSTKAKFLLTRWQKCVEHCNLSLESVSASIHPAVSEGVVELGKFLCSPVAISALQECVVVHTSRLKSRIGGVEYCKSAFEGLHTKEMAQFFVGRVLHAVPSSDLVQDDGIFSGCALADPALLANMMSSYVLLCIIMQYKSNTNCRSSCV